MLIDFKNLSSTKDLVLVPLNLSDVSLLENRVSVVPNLTPVNDLMFFSCKNG
jgi:hypothetical protein